MSSVVSLILLIGQCIANPRGDICPILEDSECSDLLHERYDITIDEYQNLPQLKQFIFQDNIDCITEDLCPVLLDSITGEEMKCTDGTATEHGFPCKNIDLLAFLSLVDLGSHANASGSDIWGYTRYDENGEYIGYYALTGQTDGSSIVDITDPLNPNVLAFIQSNAYNPFRFVPWRDIKIMNDYAFVVADDQTHNGHHLQIFNIPNIIDQAIEYQQENGDDVIYNVSYNDPNIIIYEGFGSSHNIHINEESGYLYSVGIADCNGGVHIVDINDPLNPQFAGCYDGANYTHDIQCVSYIGPDQRFEGHEICFAFTPIQSKLPYNSSALTIIDVTDKENIIELSRTPYNFSAYNHQGWVINSHEYLLMDDEMDEWFNYTATQLTYIWDIRNLTNPILVNRYDSNLTVIDHNQYIIDNGKKANDNGFKGFVFQANYEAGLRILNIDNIANGDIYEIAYFDTYISIDANATSHDSVNPRGAWSVFPYFKPNKNKDEYSDIVVVQDINTGFYVLRVNIRLNDIFEQQDASKGMDTEEIIGIVVLSILFVFSLVAIFICCRRQHNKDRTGQETQQLL